MEDLLLISMGACVPLNTAGKGTVKMAFAYCLDCGSRIYLGAKPWKGQPVFCERCDADMEVTRVNPLELDWTDNLIDEEPEQEQQEQEQELVLA
jgi:DNA replicative helicase MCM subunit Mcm2 (Cdc46/Mcm family)